MDSNSPKQLLVDIGNSRIKFTWVSEGGRFAVQTTEQLSILRTALLQANEVVLASVKDNQYNDSLITLCQQHEITVTHVESTSSCFGIQCAYQNFKNLGVDRWLAVLGARALTDKPVAVIDLGTAATCDLVVGEQHLGGWITPGFSMMREAVVNGASRVFSDQNRPTYLSLGRDTPECVNLGCMAMLNGLVLQAQKYLGQFSQEHIIYVCGGDRDLLAQIDDPQVIVEKDLVFVGLKRFLIA